MDKLDLAAQPETEPNFIDSSFKENPSGGSASNFSQWQPVEDFLVVYGKQVTDDDGLANHGGSSHGSHTGLGSPQRRHFASGNGETNGSNINGSSSSDMQDVNSPYPDSARTDTGASVQKERKRTDNLRALNKLAQQRYRERKRKEMEQLHQKRSDYFQTLDAQQAAAITDTNKQLEADNQKLEEQLRSLSTNGSDTISYIHPRAPSSVSENGYSGESDGSSSSPAMFNTRVGSNIPATPNHKADYEKTEKAWFAKIEELRQTMTKLGFWGEGPVQRQEALSNEDIMSLVGSLQGVVELCCKVAKMEGLQMNTLLNRTYQTCSNLQSWKEPERWIKAARDVMLSADQKKSFAELRTSCLDILKKIYAQRQDLSAKVLENLVPTDAPENIDPASSGKKGLNDIMFQLEENLKEEQRFNCHMLFTTFKFLLNPVQAGWLILKSFPEHVDVLAFMNAVDELQR